MEPILTAEEWAKLECNEAWVEGEMGSPEVVCIDGLGSLREPLKVANLLLRGYFTHEMVDGLREEWESEWYGVSLPNAGEILLTTAAAIEALLPPKEEK